VILYLLSSEIKRPVCVLENLRSVMRALDFQGGFDHYINGEPPTTTKTRCGINPANLKEHWKVPVATKEDVDSAVTAAKHAFKTWSQVPYEERKRAVLQYADAVEQYKTSFRDLLVAEQGKPTAQADIETTYAIEWMRGMADIELKEEVIEESKSRTVITRYLPIGVVAALIPWNFPLMLATAKIAPALLTGNVIIVKPSPFTPYGGLKLVELAQKFFPPGVVQSLSGDDDLGPWLTSHPGIDKISFTGSTATGKAVMQSASKTLKRVTLELGGNDPAIVLADVDIDKVAAQVALYAFLNSGQICLNLKRIYVHEKIFDEFSQALVEHVKAYRVGDGAREGVTHGPLQNQMQYKRVKTFFDDIHAQGWKVAVGGDMPSSEGYFFNPTIIDRPPENSRIVVEEPFGPIVPLLSWSDEEDVISRANDTTMGLGASVWSNDVKKATEIGKRLQAGSVWINKHFDLSPYAAFGGHKQSGIGTEWGLNGLKGFCNVQSLFVNKQADN
jgi:acyl-CoA reductase-like NAD-dependent aldehyde dehydrogenase